MTPTIEIDARELLPPPVVKLAGLALVAAGLFGLGGAVQVLVVFEGALHTLLALPGLLAAAGAVLVGPYVYDGRSWAPFAGGALVAAVGLLSLAWFLYALAAFVLAPALLLAIGGAGGALALLPFAVAPALRVTAARRALLA